MTKKQKLEKEIKEIKLQLLSNRELEIRKRQGENVCPKDEIWVLRARQALLIKRITT